MSPARKTPQSAAPSARDRAAALRKRAPRWTPERPSPVPDPVFAAINRHRGAYGLMNAYTDDCPEADAASEREDAAWADMLATRPSSLAGLIALVRAFGQHARLHTQKDGEAHLFTLVAEYLSALSGADDPACALVDAIEREWARFAIASDSMRGDVGPGSDARWEPYAKRRDALLLEAEALPATTREGRHAKALALAWMEFVACWQQGKPRDEYGLADGYALDIEAGIRGRDGTPAPAACEAARIGLLIAENGAELLRLDAIGEHDEAESPRVIAWDRAEGQANALRQALSYARARSAGGILAQIAVAGFELDGIRNGSMPDHREASFGVAERCLNSAAAAVARLHHLDREGYGASRYLPAQFDRLAILDAREA